MTLLLEVMTRPLDPGYEAAAERRRVLGTQDDAGARARSALAVLALIAVGLLLATAWWQTRGTRPAGVIARDQLAAEIQRQDAAAGRLQQQNAALVAQIEAERSRQLQLSAQSGLAEQVTTLGLVTGATAASGPGIVVTVNDAEAASGSGDGSNPRAQQNADDGRVLDQDLQLVVNGLWDAGAEAMAINGQRLTALSAIRSAGQAILVDYRPLSPPYKISAIGDPQKLQSRFMNGAGGRDLQYLKDNFGIRFDLTSSSRLTLPASAGLTTRRAKALERSTTSSSTTSSSTTSSSSTSSSDSSGTRASTRSTQETP
ncbi:hypothetical protein ASD06_03600 [Angustibacter sp. Root456]|nr:hypothetical protein ASD06_03600 [Angustibacter sp. Root456]